MDVERTEGRGPRGGGDAVGRAGSSAEADALDRRAAIHHALGEPHRLAIVDALQLSDRAPSELAALVGVGTNLVTFHLDVLEAAGIVERTPSQGDARRRYVRLRRGVLASLAPRPSTPAEDVLFVCTANSARSQLAAALWRAVTGRAAGSAGAAPADRVHPLAVEAARRRGLDLEAARPRRYDEVPADPGLVVSVCDRAREGGLPFAAPTLHWSIPDPVGGGPEAFDRALAELDERIGHLARAVAAGPPTLPSDLPLERSPR
jgi:ArsR family transcriptional regulator, arsenate/arsenite/antimonite-responsive transcriptional repressor / arsenate reductase (thioredoxin)